MTKLEELGAAAFAKAADNYAALEAALEAAYAAYATYDAAGAACAAANAAYNAELKKLEENSDD
jgi:hypothetical protein